MYRVVFTNTPLVDPTDVEVELVSQNTPQKPRACAAPLINKEQAARTMLARTIGAIGMIMKQRGFRALVCLF
jgi:hypothetical protein